MSRQAPTYDMKPPPGYIAGAGRGATGFTTRSDIGNASAPSSNSGPGSGGAPRPAAVPVEAQSHDAQYDSFSGYSGDRLFDSSDYTNDDADADKVYAAVDDKMSGRNKRRREEKESEGIRANLDGNGGGKISDQFKELKSKLASVTEEEWSAIPEVGDRSLKYKSKEGKEVYTPLVDSMVEKIASILGGKGDKRSLDVGVDGVESTVDTGSTSSLITAAKGSKQTSISTSRSKHLSKNLDSLSDSVSGQTVIDPKGYLTSLSMQTLSTTAEIGDIKKARLLLKSVRDTNPKHGPGWIASARVEEFAGRVIMARKLIKDGCEACPDSEDVWLESVRLQPGEIGKSVVASAIGKIPKSVKLFLCAADLEHTASGKKSVLRKALEAIPNSVKLWKEAIELESSNDAKILLARAVECVPHSVDMWLALARLETYDNARKVLNAARKALPTEVGIWVTAARLEEGQNNGGAVTAIIQKAVAMLSHGAEHIVKREGWIKEAEGCERSGCTLTTRAIVDFSVGLGVDKMDRMRTFVADAEGCVERGSVETARAIYAYTLAVDAFKGKKGIWLKAVDLEKTHGTPEQLDGILRQAVTNVPNTEVLWLMYAKEKWVCGDVTQAREILTEAFAANPNSEQVWLAAGKLEWENEEFERARVLYKRARERAPTARVFMKSAMLEREMGCFDEALVLLEEACKLFPTFSKFYMMGGQIANEDQGSVSSAREWYGKGLALNDQSCHLWILAARLEETFGSGSSKARSLLELGRLKNKSDEYLWLAAVRLERRCGNEKGVQLCMSKALQECPASGRLWAEEIEKAPRTAQKSKSMDAIKNANDNPHVIVAVAGLFINERKYEKARKWFHRAVTLNPDFGDGWVRWFAFEKEQGKPSNIASVLQQCVKAEPTHGEIWNSYAKVTGNRRKSVEEKLEGCLEVVREAIKTSAANFTGV